MKREWIRLYVDVPNDPKVQALPPALFRFWINCLCLCGNDVDGCLPDTEEIAFRLRVERRVAVKWVSTLRELHLLDTVCARLRPHGWTERQYVSDVSTQRVKEHRERKRNVSRNANETPSEAEADTEQNRAEQNAAALLDLHVPRIIENAFGRPEKNPARLKVEEALRKARSRIETAENPAAYELRIVTDELRTMGVL